jgi:hypothetical protein
MNDEAPLGPKDETESHGRQQHQPNPARKRRLWPCLVSLVGMTFLPAQVRETIAEAVIVAVIGGTLFGLWLWFRAG